MTAAYTEWHLLESDARKPTLYAGGELAGVLRGYDAWNPTQGTHRPDDALLIARGLVKANGIVIYVTDRKIDLPSDVAVLSAGTPVKNVGFAGAEVSLVSAAAGEITGTRWKALVRNYSDEAVEREWWVEEPGAPKDAHVEVEKRKIQIPPGQTLTLSGEFTSDVNRAVLVLAGDKFVWDDRLPVQKPRPRVVEAEVRLGGPMGALWRKMLSATGQVELRGGPSTDGSALRAADLMVSELGTPMEVSGIQTPTEGGEGGQLDAAWTVAENHPLVRDLNWMGLLTPRPTELTVTEADEPLLWKGDRVLAMVRRGRTPAGRPLRRLLLTWDLAQSNAVRHPAMLVLIHRFVEEVRHAKLEPWAGNFEMGQNLEVVKDDAPEAPPLRIRMQDKASNFEGRLPEQIGFFEVLQGEKPLVSGAAHFADAREADFREAGEVDTVEQRRWEAALKQTEADPLMPLWVLLVLACLLASWGWGQSRRAPKSTRPPLQTSPA